MSIAATREIRAKTSAEVAYLVTSLTKAEASPARLLALARAHWSFGNALHWKRDVAMNEDRSRSRAGARPFASLRHFALAIIRTTGLSTPGVREAFAADTNPQPSTPVFE
jgi:predicted transposase YbfD/YdcC